MIEQGDPDTGWGEANAASEAVMRAEREAGAAGLCGQPGTDLPDRCAYHGGEGDGGEFCDGCREDQGEDEDEIFSYPIPLGDDAARLLGY